MIGWLGNLLGKILSRFISPVKQTQAIINWLDAGIIPQNAIRVTVLKELTNTIEKAKADGEDVASVMRSLEKDAKVMELFKKLHISREMIKAEATRILIKS